MVSRSELAKPMNRCNIAACFSKIADERQRKIELTCCVKNVSSMQQIALSSVHRLRWWGTQRDLTQTKPGPRQLTVIGGRIAGSCRVLCMHALELAGRFGCPAPPIRSTR